MATRPCLRCSKLVPESAAFCRRCGVSLRGRKPAAVAAAAQPPPPTGSSSPRGRGSGLVVVTSALAVGAAMALFTASIPRATLLPTDPGPPAEVLPDTDAGVQRLARMREHLASARERLAAARQRLVAARPHVAWRVGFERGVPTEEPPTPAAAEPQPPPAPEPADPEVEQSDGPRITRVSHARATPGSHITIEGRGFRGTYHVLFVAVGDPAGGWAEAQFRVRHDGLLRVTVPDVGAGERPAALVVATPEGAAVTLPSEAGGAAFVSARAGSTLSTPPGAAVVVDSGAWALAPSGSLVVVRRGGGVEKARRDCFILHETRNPQARDLSITPVLDVPAVYPCFVDSLFQYCGQ